MLKFVTYNIKNSQPGDPFIADWSVRKIPLMKYLEKSQADIIGLQEVTEEQFTDLQKLDSYAIFGSVRDREIYGEYTPILYRRDRFTLCDSGTFWLSETPTMMSLASSWGAACYRIVTWGRFIDRLGDKEFLLLNTHLDHVSAIARKCSIKQILEFLNKQKVPHVVLMGDFNSDNSEDWYSHLCETMHDAMAETSSPTTSDWTYVDFDTEEKGVIDYIFLNGEFIIHSANATSIGVDTLSDHRPVEVLVEFR
ncbi:TPA: endonuclease/exonuclease/phosphatase family protein [Streptococcus suis]|nr:endonuclease/exonuclease/phosphatase family protein [Streptococcus suis]HEM3649043.1 endonuclease/exonuclease/phosphatase family protein [Streptococcus suis]